MSQCPKREDETLDRKDERLDPQEQGVHEPSAGRILAFHADHSRGLHATPLAGCSECLLDRVMGASETELVDLLESAAESA